MEQRINQHQEGGAPPFRVDVQLHQLLVNKQPAPRQGLDPAGGPQPLPEPVFPLPPEIVNREPVNGRRDPNNAYSRRWTAPLVYRAMRGWLFPYMKSRILPGDF